MALLGGHRFAVSMDEVFPRGFYAMGVEQAMDYDEKSGRRTPARDKVSGDLVWDATGVDRDPEAREKQVKVKVAAPYSPVLPGEIVPGSGLHAVEFSGLTVTPWVNDGRGRPRLAFSFRAAGVYAQGKAPAAAASGRSGGQAPGAAGGDGKAA